PRQHRCARGFSFSLTNDHTGTPRIHRDRLMQRQEAQDNLTGGQRTDMIRRFGNHPSRWPRILLRATLATLTLACLLWTARIASAQAVAGMTGTVTDSTGAVIPNAKVTITNVNTSVTNHAVTSSAGTYSVRGLIPGTYQLTVEAPGFQKSVQSGILIEVSTVATINATLQPGSTTEVVAVTANPIALNTTQPQI